LITVASGNADHLMVGRLLGSGALGFYAMAWDLLRFVPDRLYRVAGRVAMPTFCRLQDDDQELARAYRNFVAYIGCVILPIAACVALAAPEFLSSIYGEKWLPAAAPMRLLAGGLALVGLRIGIGCIYYTKDYPSFDIYLNGLRLLLLVTVIAAVSGSGLLAVSAGVSLTEALIGLAGQYLVCALLNLRFRDLVGAVKPGLRLAAVCLLATAAGKVIGMFAGIRPPMVLALVAIPPAIAFCWMEAGDISQMIGQAFAKTIRKMPDSEDGVQA
jgi:O-antigen/teichoic acid export membrane protein